MSKKQSNGKWFNNIARLIKKKAGGYFLVFERQKNKDGEYIGESPYPLTINEGDILQARLKKEDLAGLVKKGKMSQETADKICEHVKFEFSKAPASTEKGKSSTNNTPDDSGEVDF